MLDIRRDIYALDTFSDEDAKQINKEIVRELAYKIMRIRDNLTNEFKMFCNSIDIEFLDDIERYIYNSSEPILYYHDEPKPTSEYRHNFCGLHYSVARGQFVSGYPCYYWELKPIVFSNKDNQTIIELKFLYDTIIPGKTPIELFVKDVSLNMRVRKVRQDLTIDEYIDYYGYDDNTSETFVDDLLDVIRHKVFEVSPIYDKKRIVYLSHPYRGKSNTDTEKMYNIRMVDKILHKIVQKYPEVTIISPVHTFLCLEGLCDGNFILEKCYDLLALCNEIWVFGDYENSQGCQGEIDFAKKHNIVVRKFDTEDFLSD